MVTPLKETPGFYAGLPRDPRQTEECLSRNDHANLKSLQDPLNRSDDWSGEMLRREV